VRTDDNQQGVSVPSFTGEDPFVPGMEKDMTAAKRELQEYTVSGGCSAVPCDDEMKQLVDRCGLTPEVFTPPTFFTDD